MKKLLSALVVLLASAVLALAAPGTVVKVTGNSVTVHWNVAEGSMTSHHGLSGAGLRGTSREYTFAVTPSTVYTVNGGKGSLGSLQKGMHVNVKHTGLTATQIDVVP